MAHSKFCYLVKLTTLLTLLRCSEALPSVTNLEPCNSRTCTVPKTLPDNVTLECVLNSPAMSGPIWEITRSSSQLPLKNHGNHGLQIIFTSNLLQNQGYLLQNPFQNYSTLDITKQARQEYAQIRVQCIEFVETENVASDYYYVFTYGAPDPPQKFALQASSSSSSLSPFLTWKRPPNIHADVSLTYNLQITNLTSNVSRIYMTDTLSYTLPMPEGSGCSLFEFSITASNDVGDSTSVSIIETLPITPDVGPINSSLRVLSVDVSGGSVAVTLAFDEAETCSERYNVTDYTVVSSDGSISVSINTSSDVNYYTVTLDSANAPNITRGFAYNISVIACIDISDTACNSNGCQESTQLCQESKTIEVFTTDVQNPRVRYVRTDLKLTCDFAEGSTAEGCLFSFTGITTQENFLVNRSGNSSMATSCDVANATADNVDFMWHAFDDIGGVPVTVELIAVGSQDKDNFKCQQNAGGGQGPSRQQSLTGGRIAGIVVGVVGAVVISGVILIGYIVYKAKKEKKKIENERNEEVKLVQQEMEEVRRQTEEKEQIRIIAKEEEVTKNFSTAQEDSGSEQEDELGPLLTWKMEVVSKEERTVRFKLKYNTKAIRREINSIGTRV